MTVGKCKDFQHPEGFGFSTSAGKVAVRPHVRGPAMCKGGEMAKGGPVKAPKGQSKTGKK